MTLHFSQWELIDAGHPETRRLRVPGGWLVCVSTIINQSVVFYPDPQHSWRPKLPEPPPPPEPEELEELAEGAAGEDPEDDADAADEA